MKLTRVEREKITDSVLKIQSVRASLDYMDETKIPELEEIQSCLKTADVSLRLVPISRVDAEEMIDDLATQALLGPFRGEPAVARDAVAGVLLALSAAAGADPTIVSADLNPLIVVDGKPVAVDALVEVLDA